MTSVQNHPLPLSGNKLIALFLLLGLFSACDLFRPLVTPIPPPQKDKEKEEDLGEIGGGRVYNPETGQFESAEEVLVQRMDTIRWRQISTRDYPPITSDTKATDISSTANSPRDGERGSKLLNNYNVAILLPFMANRFGDGEDRLDPNARWAIEFYSGIKLALAQLNEEGINLTVNTYDTKGDPRQVELLLQKEANTFNNTHLIFGTVRSECATLVANFAKQREIPFVSPFIASTSITRQNPYYIQVTPSLATHLEATTKHIKDNYNSDQVVIVAKKNEDELKRMQYIQQINQALSGSSYAKRFEELVIEDSSPNLGKTNIAQLLRAGRTTVFFIPSWSDKAFIFAFLRKAFASRSNNTPIVVYGMRQWRFFDDADFNHYENLKLHISSEYNLDVYLPEVRTFRQRHYEQYGKAPSAEAIRGYENMLYFGRMLHLRGTKFFQFFEEETKTYFHTKFEFVPVQAEGENSARRDKLDNIDRFENKFVHILKFEDFYFQSVK